MRLVPARCGTDPGLKPLLDAQGRTVDDEWVLCDPLVWLLMDEDFTLSNETVTVPAGFVTDLASIPAPLRLFLNVNGKSRRASIAHDWLYSSNEWSRADADEFLRIALITEGVSPAVARVYWLGVRAGGWRYYNQRVDGLGPDDFTA